MTSVTLNKQDLLLSVLAMDAYNQGYDSALDSVSVPFEKISYDQPDSWKASGFYADQPHLDGPV